jgi:hypothetical protein
MVNFPFNLEQLPENGIYFFYEKGESWGHGGTKPRIVRVGTHRDGNFRSRIKEHYLLDQSKMDFDRDKPAPRERSIFRKHIGRALLNGRQDDYLKTWEIDFTSRENRNRYRDLRDIQKEKEIESEITRILRSNFSFRFILVDDQFARMGSGGLESPLIGTLAQCRLCGPTAHWLGGHFPKNQIRESGLWLIHHLKAKALSESEKSSVLNAIMGTRKWIERAK